MKPEQQLFRDIKKEDYEEPCCPLQAPSDVTPVPMARIMEKLDFYYDKNDLAAAERHVTYWLDEARAGADARGELTLLNELIGIARKTGQKEKAFAASEKALRTAEKEGLRETVVYGTTLLNAATAQKAFGESQKALRMYREAQRIYESRLDKNDGRLGGLYNNMALALADTGDLDGAEKLYRQAFDIMGKQPQGQAEQAITLCNLADLTEEKYGAVDADAIINGYLDKAMELLDSPALERGGYYAFVCEKCAPTFGYFGYFLYENELKKRVENIYART